KQASPRSRISSNWRKLVSALPARPSSVSSFHFGVRSQIQILWAENSVAISGSSCFRNSSEVVDSRRNCNIRSQNWTIEPICSRSLFQRKPRQLIHREETV